MASKQEPRSCGVLLTCGDPIAYFLLMQHRDRWDLPKGHVDPGESDIECALREMEEETGIPRTLVTLDPHFRYEQQYEVAATRYGGKRKELVTKTMVIFLGRTDCRHPIVATEHHGGEWFPWNPPHRVQKRAIDPLLKSLEAYLG
jgi:bis(5'-nucleosidyl)-tetraphosphatase